MIRDIPKRAGGSFKVGKLSTHIGQFEVKNPELDQYEAGTYSGNFCIDKIYPSHYIAGGKIVIELRAVLSCFVLAGFDEETTDMKPLDVDPADEEAVAPASGNAAPEAEPDAAPVDLATNAETEAATAATGVMTLEEERRFREELMDKETFGELYPLGHEVKLDPTIVRTKLRAQCDRLKSLGYRFVAARQIWAKHGEKA
ncbi:DUF3275 family protein [Thiothrix subterranea]|uniref:DUF3275 family protein n=1 Tax=Thiothrix subterranea TaxID=2735563 RepID=UPI00280ADFED|nr:DUF3275 family protein [Thiothrix subterranea]